LQLVGYQGLGQLQLWLPNFLPKSNEKNLVTVKEMQLLTLKQGKNVQLGVFMVPLPLPWNKKKKRVQILVEHLQKNGGNSNQH
jgi:hypothetical protein